MLLAGKYPETEEEMMQWNQDHSVTSKLSYELISKNQVTESLASNLTAALFSEPEQRFRPKLNVIEFELELFRGTSKTS